MHIFANKYIYVILSAILIGKCMTIYVFEYFQAKKYFLDGINIDIENPIKNNSPESKGLTALLEEMRNAFHSQIPGSQARCFSSIT